MGLVLRAGRQQKAATSGTGQGEIVTNRKEQGEHKLSEAQILLGIHIKELGMRPAYEVHVPAGSNYRFDVCCMGLNVLIEISGGNFSGGHRRGTKQEDEYTKINRAQMSGYKVYQFTNRQVLSGEAKEFLRGETLSGDREELRGGDFLGNYIHDFPQITLDNGKGVKYTLDMTITAHDVRRIKICSQCGEIGIYKPKKAEVELPLVICTNSLRAPGAVADYQHPMCYAPNSHTPLMLLPKEERDTIRLCDVSKRAMQAILSVGNQ
jgi:hypothetical protein